MQGVGRLERQSSSAGAGEDQQRVCNTTIEPLTQNAWSAGRPSSPPIAVEPHVNLNLGRVVAGEDGQVVSNWRPAHAPAPPAARCWPSMAAKRGRMDSA